MAQINPHDHIGLCIQYALRRRPKDEDLAEYINVAYIGLCKAAEKYDPERGAFSTCAMLWMRQTINRFIEEQQIINKPVHLQDTNRQNGESTRVPIVQFDEAYSASYEPPDIEASVMVATLLAHLSDSEREVLELEFFNEMSQSEIAASMGVSRQRVNQKRLTALKKLRQILTSAEKLV